MSTNRYVIQYEKERAEFKRKHEAELASGGKLFDVILEGDGLWHAHRAGCSDVARTITKRACNGVSTYVAKSVEDLLAQIIDPDVQELGYTKSDVVVLPCCESA